MDGDTTKPLAVVITHEPFMGEPFNVLFQLEFNNQTEELDHREALQWFKNHGAKEDVANNALNEAANFGSAEVVIAKPIFPKAATNADAPSI